jgi:hypothetical protein
VAAFLSSAVPFGRIAAGDENCPQPETVNKREDFLAKPPAGCGDGFTL